PPAASISATAVSHFDTVRLDATTDAPARASAIAMPRPTPDPAPVTIATLPASIVIAPARSSVLSAHSRVDDADLGRGLDEQVVEVATERPADVHGVVHDELLELLVRHLARRQCSAQLLARLAVDA